MVPLLSACSCQPRGSAMSDHEKAVAYLLLFFYNQLIMLLPQYTHRTVTILAAFNCVGHASV